MKKNILAALFFAGMGASFVATAAPVAANTGFEGSGDVSITACTLLADPVTLNLSKNVVGAYNCNEANSIITVAACHKGGSRSERNVVCVADPDDASATIPAGCTVGESVPITDYVGYKAGSNGGSIATEALGGACATGTVTGLL
ncbi:hypothetical protein NGA35_01460 [Pseudomonas stutzeri]|nr:hypothetical protein [Stutzerimonas stutzeri]